MKRYEPRARRALRSACAAATLLTFESGAAPADATAPTFTAATAPTPSRNRPLVYHFTDAQTGAERLVLAFGLTRCGGRMPASAYVWSAATGGEILGDLQYCETPEQFEQIEFRHLTVADLGKVLSGPPVAYGVSEGHAPPRRTDPRRPLPLPHGPGVVELGSSREWDKLYYAALGATETPAVATRPTAPQAAGDLPSDADVAGALAEAFFKANPETSLIQSKVWRYRGQTSAHGYSVFYDLAPIMGQYAKLYGRNAYDEEYIFFVQDQPGPNCRQTAPDAASCDFALHTEMVLDDFMNDVGTAFTKLLSGRGNEGFDDPRRQWSGNGTAGTGWKKGFTWSPMRASFTRSGGAWHSVTLQAAFVPVVRNLNTARDQMAHRRYQAATAMMDATVKANTCIAYAMTGKLRYAPRNLGCVGAW